MGLTWEADELLALGDLVRSNSSYAVVEALLRGRTKLAHLDPKPPPGAPFERVGRLWSTLPMASELLGRVIDPIGRPLDGRPLEAPLVPMSLRSHYGRSLFPNEPLWTGRKVIDLMLALRRGCSHLLAGPVGSGTKEIALDALANQAGTDVVGIFTALDGTSTTLQRARLAVGDALPRTIFVHAPATAEPALRNLLAPAAVLLGEQIRAQGGHALVVIDRLDLHEAQFIAAEQLLDRAGQLARDTEQEQPVRLGSLTILVTADIASTRLSPLIGNADQRTYLNADGSLDFMRTRGLAERINLYWLNYKAVHSILMLNEWRSKQFALVRPELLETDAWYRWTLARGERFEALMRQSPGKRMPIADQLLVAASVSEGFANHLPLEQFAAFESEVLRLAWTLHPEAFKVFDPERGRLSRKEVTGFLATLRQMYGDPSYRREARL